MIRQRVLRWSSAAAVGLALLSSPTPAAAWDPSTTHQGLLESGLTRSALHLRWMDASALERGLFTSLRLDPDRLAPADRRLLQLAIKNAHADSGALPLGGPGACPSATAPAATQMFCVDQDLWENSALGWLRLGMVAEVTPPARHSHHFLDRDDLDASTWVDRELPAVVLRTRQARSNGEPRAGIATGTNFDGKAPTALAWLEDPNDPLAPPQTFAHLALASSAETQAERDHELALALIGVGALIHVAQDLSVPAHARGDATAFFAPLSPAAGDRGLPLQEFVRVEFGRSDMPGVSRKLPDDAATRPAGVPLAQTLVGHLLGEGSYEGIARFAAQRFLSESSLPAPKFLGDELSPSEAAAALLGDDHQLAPAEVAGAVLSPWPAEAGYLLSSTGRALAAFDTDIEGRVRLYLDETAYRDQAAILLPAAAEMTTSLFDLLWPAWPQMSRNGDAVTLAIPDWESAELTVLIETTDGQRRVLGRHPLAVDGETRVELGLPPQLEQGERVVLLLNAARKQGPRIVVEQLLESARTVDSLGPQVIEPQAIQPQPLTAQTVEPQPAEPQAAEPEPAEPEAIDPDAVEAEAVEPEPAEPQAVEPD